MKILRLLLPLLLTVAVFTPPTRAQAPAFVPTPVPIAFATATDAVFFARGFLVAEDEIVSAIPLAQWATFSQMALNNATIAHLFFQSGYRSVAFYFYGRAQRFEWAAYEAGELNPAVSATPALDKGVAEGNQLTDSVR